MVIFFFLATLASTQLPRLRFPIIHTACCCRCCCCKVVHVLPYWPRFFSLGKRISHQSRGLPVGEHSAWARGYHTSQGTSRRRTVPHCGPGRSLPSWVGHPASQVLAAAPTQWDILPAKALHNCRSPAPPKLQDFNLHCSGWQSIGCGGWEPAGAGGLPPH